MVVTRLLVGARLLAAESPAVLVMAFRRDGGVGVASGDPRWTVMEN